MDHHRQSEDPLIRFDEIYPLHIRALFQEFEYMVGKTNPDDYETGHYDVLAFSPHPCLMPGIYSAVKKVMRSVWGIFFGSPIA